MEGGTVNFSLHYSAGSGMPGVLNINVIESWKAIQLHLIPGQFHANEGHGMREDDSRMGSAQCTEPTAHPSRLTD